MKTSARGRAWISKREANKLKAYKDSVGVLTIGVGHTSAAGPPKVTSGMTITEAESDAILSRDLAKFEQAVSGAVKVPLSQTQFDALVSLAFNIGGGAFSKSTLVRKLNKGDIAGAADAFLTWNKAGGKTLPGLTKRRQSERAQFLSGEPASAHPAPVATIPPIEPKPVPAPAPASDKEMIKRIQTGLTLLNYNPGGIDGIIGPLTAGAIRIFRADNGLPEGDFIDDALITALASAKPREMVAARANATTAQVATVVAEAKAHWWQRAGAVVAGAPVAVAGAADYIAPAGSYIQQAMGVFSDVPVWVWVIGFLVLCGALYYAANHGLNKATEAFQSGDRR